MRKASLTLLISLSLLKSQAQSHMEIYEFPSRITTDTSNAEETSVSFSFIGDYQQALHYRGKLEKPSDKASARDSALFKSYKPLEASEYLLKRARSTRAIFINEAHHVALHRMFAASLLQGLYDQGFRYLALEALYPDDTLVNSRKYPSLQSGFYCSEPRYGDMMRQALNLGYTLVSYESYADDNNAMTDSTGTIRFTVGQNNRELSQARNLKRILLKDPEARIIVYTGESSLEEDSTGKGIKPVAAYFKELSGIEPLLIDQVKMQEKEIPDTEDPFYRMSSQDRSSVYVKNKKLFKSENPVYIFHPASRYLYSRPDWVFRDKRKPMILKEADISIDCPCIISAYRDNEDPNLAVPSDVIEIDSKGTRKALALRPGDYLLMIRNPTTRSAQLKIRIK